MRGDASNFGTEMDAELAVAEAKLVRDQAELRQIEHQLTRKQAEYRFPAGSELIPLRRASIRASSATSSG